MKPPLVSVIIPNWNGRHFLEACLDSLKIQTFKNHEIIVIDNGSTDGSVEFITSHYPEVQLIRHPVNLGFTGGVNAGIMAATGQYIALLNNDAVADPSWLAELVKDIDQYPDAGAVTSKMLAAAGTTPPTIDSTGQELSIWGFAFARGSGEADHGQYDSLVEVFGCSGGATLYRKAFFESVGLFDDAYFAYYEDVDLSFRGQLAGYKFYFCPSAIVHHAVGGTSGGKRSAFTRYHTVKNFFYLYFKNMPLSLLLLYSPLFLFSGLLMLAGSIRHGLIVAHLRGLGALILHLPTLLAQRIVLQRARKLSAAQVNALLYHDLPPLQRSMLKSVLWFVR